ncbi:MAG: ATP-binding protein [Bacteroidetes bacterium]|nr:ATP-binding protein [Bacteroidota bacterium]
MLLEFRVRNYRTFKDEVVFSMIASNYDKSERESENVRYDDKFKLRILKSAAIFGANASGKSKFVEALSFVRWFALNSFQSLKNGDPIQVNQHLLSKETSKKPSGFELVFLQDDTIYRYGFEVDTVRVVKEWLWKRENRKEVMIFNRDGEEVNAHPALFKIFRNEFFKPLIRSNCLLLSSAAQANDVNVEKIMQWFRKLRILSGIDSSFQEKMTVSNSMNPEVKKKILQFLISADIGIVNFNIKNLSLDKTDDFDPTIEPSGFVKVNSLPSVLEGVTTTHLKFDEKNGSAEEIEFSMINDESGGTRKFFSLAYPIVEALADGNTLVVDELDSGLHPNLTEKIVELFNSIGNVTGAQLIFNTHGSNILSSKLLRRDQVWFIEKDLFGAAKLYSLSDIQVRKNDRFEKEYLEGRYGAIPYLAEMSDFFGKHSR